MKNIFEEGSPKPKTPEPDMGNCGSCGMVSYAKDCEYDYDHHDGWGMKAYGVHICPKCPDGELEDYSYSDKQWIKYLEYQLQKKEDAIKATITRLEDYPCCMSCYLTIDALIGARGIKEKFISVLKEELL